MAIHSDNGTKLTLLQRLGAELSIVNSTRGLRWAGLKGSRFFSFSGLGWIGWTVHAKEFLRCLYYIGQK